MAIPFLAAFLEPTDWLPCAAAGASALPISGYVILKDEPALPVAMAWMGTIFVAALLGPIMSRRLALSRRAELEERAARADAERALAASEESARELERLAHTERLAVIGGLTAGIAHEVKNSLSLVMGALDELTQSEDADAASLAVEALESLDSVRTLIQGLGTASRAPAPASGSSSVSQVVADALTLSRSRWRHVAQVTAEVPEDLPEVAIGRVRLLQVLVNLILNACDALSGMDNDEGRIRLSGQRSGRGVALTIADNGPGIAPDMRERIFEAFFTTKPAGKGTGLGLSLCRAHLAEVGGELELGESEGGAAFVLRLPEVADQKAGN